MDAVTLARIQFAMSVGFHYLFPTMTFGLTLLVVIFESMYVKTSNEKYKNLSNYLIKMLALVFVLGVSTGITLEFSFGTNWSEYSRIVGDVFGSLLAIEALSSFFLESVFIAVLLFARNKVSKKFYLLSTFLVFFASHMSGFWILAANSFMQTPAGYESTVVAGRETLIMTDFWSVVFNHSTVIRFLHSIVSGWIAGSLMILGISAWYIYKNKFVDLAKTLFKVSMIIFAVMSILQLFIGHFHSVQVGKTQPAKMAAFEGLWETQKGAPLAMFGFPDEEKEETHVEIGIPRMLSMFLFFDMDAEVQGLKDFPKEDRPPVFMSFWSYHVMIGLGMFFIALGLAHLFFYWRKTIWDKKWLLLLTMVAIPLPHVATQTGWMAAEIGRQPWIIYGVLRTSEGASITVGATEIWISLIMLALIYSLLFLVFMVVLFKIIRKGPESVKLEGY